MIEVKNDDIRYQEDVVPRRGGINTVLCITDKNVQQGRNQGGGGLAGADDPPPFNLR